MKQPVQVTPEFRAFMREVAARLDWGDDPSPIGPQSLHHACDHGGAVGRDTFRFTYIGRDGRTRWEIELRERQLREVAAGRLDVVNGVELVPEARASRTEPLLVWGEHHDDALRVRSQRDLTLALDALRAIGRQAPLLVRLWSTTDAQVVAALDGEHGALYVVASARGYGTSLGDPTCAGAFEVADYGVGLVAIASCHCLPWRVVRGALLQFARTGDLGVQVRIDGSIPSQLLMLGDFDRATELASRRAPTELAQLSLPRMAPHGAWAERLLAGLVELHLIELDTSLLDAVIANTALRPIDLREGALDSLAIAGELARDLAGVRGVVAARTTAGELQIALRCAQDAPTRPVEIQYA